MKTIQKIAKITGKGQITLPAVWRKAVKTEQVLLEIKGDKIEITPARLEKKKKEFTVFDALRDNKGKGLKVQDLVKMLDKLDG